MSSSDSEDDCYGNVVKKLETLRNQYVEQKITLKDISFENSKLSPKPDVNTIVIDLDDCNTTLNNTDNDDWSLDAIIAKNTTPKRGRKRKFNVASESITTGRRTRSKTAYSNNSDTVIVVDDLIEDSGGTKRGRGRGRDKTKTSRLKTANIISPISKPARNSTRGKRGNSRGATTTRRGGRGRKRGNSTSRGSEEVAYPTYSIGNTDEYPDTCDNQELFSKNLPQSNNILIIDDEDPLANDNEELSVKVYWQHMDVVRFNIRRYQKLKTIFNFFTERENVDVNKLVFMYNDKIVKADDTPDSIDYNIAKFLDGGIVMDDITGLMKDSRQVDELKGGLRIKFQCQNLKKPFETTISPGDSLGLALIKCAEHMETNIEKLKFFFDGDLISSKTTAQELDLEGGECIDVKICS